MAVLMVVYANAAASLKCELFDSKTAGVSLIGGDRPEFLRINVDDNGFLSAVL